MSLRSFSLLIAQGLLAAPACASFSVLTIYGADDRREVAEAPAEVQELGRSIAGKVPRASLRKTADGWLLESRRLGEKYCPDIRFAEQFTGPQCTGFLGAAGTLVTAGHCIRDAGDCADFVWVFDYRLKEAGDVGYRRLPEDNVYSCKRVVKRETLPFDGIDYAVLELDRPAAGRRPLESDMAGPVLPGQALFVIGHPSGLPMKVADEGQVLDALPASFTSDLDTFHGNSGSPVFDARTRKVLGIVSTGHGDYRRDGGRECKVPIVCRPGEHCSPTTVSRISNISR